MFRRRYRFVLRYGSAGALVQLTGRLNVLEREHGWVLTRIWNPAAGTLNEMIMEADYADEDAYRVERGPRYGDEHAKVLWEQIYDLVVPGSFTIEELEEIESG